MPGPILEPDPWQGRNPKPAGWSDDEYVPLYAPETHVWNEDIEANKFTIDELCPTINELAVQHGHAELTRPGRGQCLGHNGPTGSASVAVEHAKKVGEHAVSIPKSRVRCDR